MSYIVKSSLDIGGKIIPYNEQNVEKLIKEKEEYFKDKLEEIEKEEIEIEKEQKEKEIKSQTNTKIEKNKKNEKAGAE